jgi:tRNA (cmo5U34)-methyltransferase
VTIDQAFDGTVAYYDDWMRMALPGYEDVFSVARQILPFDDDASIRVLDLGAGTGLFSQHVLDRYPNAAFVLYDVAAKMLDVARERFRARQDQFGFIVGDYRGLGDSQIYDLVISSLSIHHLSDRDKRALFKQVYAALKDGGLFVNIDQIRGQTEHLRGLYWRLWLDRVRKNGAPEGQIRESIHRRQTYDRDASMADQLRWLGDAGFVSVDCVYRHTFVGLFLAMK